MSAPPTANRAGHHDNHSDGACPVTDPRCTGVAVMLAPRRPPLPHRPGSGSSNLPVLTP
ncbi:hypothetical protein ATKI12_4121 [Kitasatospora sp. Ki12]